MAGDERGRDGVDVEAIMAEIRQRVAETSSAADALFEPAPAGQEVWARTRLEMAEDAGIVVPNLTTGVSTRRLIGPVISRVKAFVGRANAPAITNLAAQQNRFNASIVGYAAALGTEVARLREVSSPDDDRIARIEERLARVERALDALGADDRAASLRGS